MHRTFKDSPSNIFLDEIRAEIRKTGQPEIVETLFHGRIAKDEPFIILSKIDIDRRKRPEGDYAPCPMCQPNKFLHGYLCWFHEQQFVAVIGRCCAAKEVVAAAERRFKFETTRAHEEEFLLKAFPLISQKRRAVALVRPSAAEARRVYRKVRAARSVHNALSQVTKDGGRLIVYEGINEAVQAAGGPAGYRRAGTQETREVSFGRMSGTTIGLSNYDPVKELNVIEQSLSLLDKGHDEEAMMNFICSLDPKERHAAVVLLREADKRFKKFNERLSDFISFFAPDNLARLNRWGEHPDSMDLRVERTHRMGLPRIEFRRHDSQAAVSPDAVMWNQQTDWIEFEG